MNPSYPLDIPVDWKAYIDDMIDILVGIVEKLGVLIPEAHAALAL